MTPEATSSSWRIPDDLWEAISPPAAPTPQHPPLRRRPAAHPRPRLHGGHPLRPAHRLPVEGPGRHPLLPGSTAHDRFQEWVEAGVFLTLWEAGLMAYDDLEGIDWSWLSMDGCMTKAPLGGKKTGKNPTDRAKKGVKRSLLVEAEGIPVGLAVDGANRPDMKMVEETLESIPVERPEPTAEEPQGLCLDKGYDYDEVREIVEEFGFTAHIRRAERRRRRSSGRPGRRRVAGWWSGRIVG